MTSSKVQIVSIVAALLPDFGIGFQGTLPWRLSKEMKYFREVTTHTHYSSKKNVVLMGRKTWESIPTRFRPLPNRINVVVSRSFDKDLKKQSISSDNDNDDGKVYYQCNSISNAIEEIKLKLGNELERIYIIGGGEIYNQVFDLVDYWLITKLQINRDENSVIPVMDTFLNQKKLNDLFIEESNNLKSFLPPTVTLPENKNDKSEYIDEEKGYRFQYSLYHKK